MACGSKFMYRIELWIFTGAWEELDKVNGRFWKKLIVYRIVKLMDILRWNMAEKEERKRPGQIVKRLYRIMYLHIEAPVKQWYECQGSNMSVRSWTMELKKSMYNTGIACVWTKQQECNLTEITKVVKDHCNNTEGQNILANLSEKTSLTLYREMNYSWGKRVYIEWCSRRERSGITWLLAGLAFERMRRNTDKGRCPSCFGEEDVKHMSLEYLETGKWRVNLK